MRADVQIGMDLVSATQQYQARAIAYPWILHLQRAAFEDFLHLAEDRFHKASPALTMLGCMLAVR